MIQLHKLSCILLILFFTGIAKENKYCVLSYNDFGPQVIAYELIGFQWWQWESQGDDNPKTSYNIQVVVYKNIGLKEIMKMFRIDKSSLKDYRYVEYEQASNFLNNKINELQANSDSSDVLSRELASLLQNTKNKITAQLK